MPFGLQQHLLLILLKRPFLHASDHVKSHFPPINSSNKSDGINLPLKKVVHEEEQFPSILLTLLILKAECNSSTVLCTHKHQSRVGYVELAFRIELTPAGLSQ